MERPAFFTSRVEVSKEPIVRKQSCNKINSIGGIKEIYDCEACGLFNKCKSPKIKGVGKHDAGIMLVSYKPTGYDDNRGGVFSGPEKAIINKILRPLSIDLNQDCYRTHLIKCKTTKKEVTATNKKACLELFLKEVETIKPKVILGFGIEVLNQLLAFHDLKASKIFHSHGLVFASHKLNCFYGGTFALDYADGIKNRDFKDRVILAIQHDFNKIVGYLDKPLPDKLSRDKSTYKLIQSSKEAIDVIKRYTNYNNPVSLDYETNSTSAYHIEGGVKPQLFTAAISESPDFAYIIDFRDNQWNDIEKSFVYDAFKKFLQSNTPIVVQASHMECSWSYQIFGTNINNLYADTAVTHHVIYCKKGTANLAYQTAIEYGDFHKDIVDVTNLSKERIDDIALYNGLDSRYTIGIHRNQQKLLDVDLKRFERFFTSCIPHLTKLQNTGVRVNKQLLYKHLNDTRIEIDYLDNKIKQNKLVKQYESKYKSIINFNSGPQLGNLIYIVGGEPCRKKTQEGKFPTDKVTLNEIQENTKNSLIKSFLDEYSEYNVLVEFATKIESYARFVCNDGRLHPAFNLYTSESMRSSSTDPNIQNVPIRSELLKRIRQAFIPSPGRILLEVDYDGLEVKIIAMVSEDEFLSNQIKSGFDPHRYWGAYIFDKTESELTSKERGISKNKWVFPNFYGAAKYSLARNLNKPEKEIEEKQNVFWGKYVRVKKWQQETLESYFRNNYVQGVTGFRRYGPLNDEKIYNLPIQGPGFHLLLNGLCKTNTRLESEHFESDILLEVHDSMLFDAVPNEVEDLISLATEILTSKQFDWQRDIPVTVSWSAGNNWAEMEKV